MVSGMPDQTTENECMGATAADVTMDPQELMALGKRHMILDEYSTAVEFLANACQQLANKHGDLGKECAPAYLMYGRCLLEMARQNLGVVEPESAKAKGTESEEKKDEPGSSSEKMEDIVEENEEEEEGGEDGEEDETEEPKPENGTDAENGTKTEEGATNGKKTGEGVPEKENGEGENTEENDEEEEDEDDADSHLKLAWTFLDLAKVIFLKENSMDGDFQAADCLMALGEVSMEGGNCDAGAKDMHEAIRLRRLHSGRLDRIVAASEYELGAALNQFQRYDEALVSLQECSSILTELSAQVTEKLKTTTDKEEEDNLQTSLKEFSELINEVKDKIAEVEEERSMRDLVKNELTEKAKETAEANNNGEAATESTTTTQPGEVKMLTARRKPTSSDPIASPARIASALVASLTSGVENIDSPATKSRVAALISMQMKRHRLDSPSATNGSGDQPQPVKRPASSNSAENDGSTNGADEDGVSSKRIRSEETDTAANNN